MPLVVELMTMASNISTIHAENRDAHCIPVPSRQIFAYLRQHSGDVRAALIGLIVAVGSCGLLLGGATVAVSSVLVSNGFGLLGAMTIGFFATGIVAASLGVYVAMTAIRRLAGDLTGDQR